MAKGGSGYPWWGSLFCCFRLTFACIVTVTSRRWRSETGRSPGKSKNRNGAVRVSPVQAGVSSLTVERGVMDVPRWAWPVYEGVDLDDHRMLVRAYLSPAYEQHLVERIAAEVVKTLAKMGCVHCSETPNGDKPQDYWLFWLGLLLGLSIGWAAGVIWASPSPAPAVPPAPVSVAVERLSLPMPSVEPPVVCVEREPIPYPVQAVSVRWEE
jgi:hypothetical protein